MQVLYFDPYLYFIHFTVGKVDMDSYIQIISTEFKSSQHMNLGSKSNLKNIYIHTGKTGLFILYVI